MIPITIATLESVRDASALGPGTPAALPLWTVNVGRTRWTVASDCRGLLAVRGLDQSRRPAPYRGDIDNVRDWIAPAPNEATLLRRDTMLAWCDPPTVLGALAGIGLDDGTVADRSELIAGVAFDRALVRLWVLPVFDASQDGALHQVWVDGDRLCVRSADAFATVMHVRNRPEERQPDPSRELVVHRRWWGKGAVTP